MERRVQRWWLGLAVLILGVAAGAGVRADDLRSAVERLGGEDCKDSSLTCLDITVPFDHGDANAGGPESNQTLSFHVAVHFAEAESKGILFYAVGGPGGAGTALADSYLSSFDARLKNEMDVVFFDQRGTGASDGVLCAKAGLAFDLGPMSLKAPDAAVAAAKGFVDRCLAEMSHRDLLPYLGTDQAVQDLEAFRQAVGAPKVWLYGESYGTQFAQDYAEHYPAALNGVILDGVVDLTRDAEQYYAEDVVTVEKLLGKVFSACDGLATCHADMTAPAAEIYDRLAAKLDAGPATVRFPIGSGGFADRELTAAILDADAFYALYGPDSRADFLRALAAAAHDSFIPLLRLGYQNLSAEPDTLAPNDDPTWYGAAYYGITCPDYDDAGHDPAARTKEILDEARTLAPRAPRLVRDFYAERLVCAFWPTKGTAARPAAFPGGDYPTLVLNSDSDPATPIANGYGVFDHAKNAYMVTMRGGPHVIWGRGLSCPDKIVFGLMLDGRKPERREQICRQDMLDAYAPLTGANLSDAFTLARGIATELDRSPELANWDGVDPISIGCDQGGSVTATSAESGTDYTFKDCAWWPGVTVNGDGISIDAGDGSKPDGMTLTLKVSGAHQGDLVYRHDSTTDAMSVSGFYDGAPVKTPRLMP